VRVVPGLVLLLALGCRGEALTPEARIRAAIGELSAAVEAGDASALRDFVSERYEDARGNDRRALVAFVTFHRMQSRQVHLLTRIRSVELREDGRASVLLVAGMAGSGAAGSGAGLRADVYRIDLDLEDEGGGVWRLVWADWHPVPATELL
jgi:hypothetical protein